MKFYKDKRKIVSHPFRLGKYDFFALAGVLICAVFYIYGVFSTTRNAFAETALSKKISGIESKISQLESDYINLKNGMTKELAAENGLFETSVIKYLSEKSIGKLSVKSI